MFNKFYESFKQFILTNYLTLLFYLVFIATLTFQLPYYIYTGGGCIQTDRRVEIENAYDTKGSFYFAYVSELPATIPTYLLAKILPNWEIESIRNIQISEDETEEELRIRDRLYLEEANTAAIFNAYEKASKKIQIHQKNLHVLYIQDRTMTDLQIGDIIQSVDGKKIENLEDIKKIVASHKVSDSLSLEIMRGRKKITCFAKIFEVNQIKMIGVSTAETYDYHLDPKLTLKFKSSESGPSGGLMLALTIYNQLVEEDITGGRKIVGTGTIDLDGNVGEIGGVTYKLQGAVKNNAEIFLVPNGDNYNDAMKYKEEHHLDIEIIGVDTFEEAIFKLQDGLKKNRN